MTTRWTFTTTGDSMTLEVNPFEMNDSQGGAAVREYSRTLAGDFVASSSPSELVEWAWTGNTYTQAQYQSLDAWARKQTPVQITTHLGRTYRVYMKSFEPEDRTPTQTKPWRHRYTMRAMVLGRVS